MVIKERTPEFACVCACVCVCVCMLSVLCEDGVDIWKRVNKNVETENEVSDLGRHLKRIDNHMIERGG